MDLDKVLLEHQANERTSLTVVHFFKQVHWDSCDQFVLRLNRLPEDILLEWLRLFVVNLRNGIDMPCRFGGSPLGQEVLPLQFEVHPHSIEVSYLNTHWRRGPGRETLLFIVDGTEASTKKFEQALIKDNAEEFGIYSPADNVYCTKLIGQLAQ